MTDDSPAKSNQSVFSAPLRSWPWGQVGWCLTGLGFTLMGVEQLGVVLGIVPPLGSDPSTMGTLAVLLILAAIVCALPAALLRWGILKRPESPIHLSWLRRVNFGLLAVAILSQMTALFVPATHAARTTALASGPWRDHPVAGGLMQISTPANWEIVQNPNAPVSGIHLVDRQNELSLTAVLVPKQDLAVRSLMELAEQSAKSLAESLTDPLSGETVPGELEGHSTVDLIQGGTLKGVNLVWYTRQIEFPEAWVELRMWATRSRYENHAETFGRIAASIRQTR